MTAREPPVLPSIDHFLFSAPLYKKYSLGPTLDHVYAFYEPMGTRGAFKFSPPSTIKTTADGYCRGCKMDTPFLISPIKLTETQWKDIEGRISQDRLEVTCPRNPLHCVTVYFLIDAMVIQKIGQFPSFSDVVIDKTQRKYKKVLTEENSKELNTAIALAAHGEGIGAFVYLRRVFERLVHARFDEAKDAERWTEEHLPRYMDQKVSFLKNHLPEFLVQNQRIYSIFSAGVHELDNDTCLEFFPVGLQSIIVILQDDLRRREEAATRKELREAIVKFELPKRTKT